MFLAVHPDGHFFTGRANPQLVLLDCFVEDGKIKLAYKGKTLEVDLEEVYRRKQVLPAELHAKLRQDGYDCGDEVAAFLSEVLEEDARMVVYSPELFTERTAIPNAGWWRNPVPTERRDDSYFVDLAQFMITTKESLDEVNELLGRSENPINSVQFRGNIVVDKCSQAWDEDMWSELRFGDHSDSTVLQCYKPCTRCIFTTVDPETGTKDPAQQPLQMLKERRMAPPDLVKDLGKLPIFGVNAGTKIPGYIYEGQTVWARLKPCAF
ncbi:unnamed protein product, partial [Mesorhabditis spiculigera]